MTYPIEWESMLSKEARNYANKNRKDDYVSALGGKIVDEQLRYEKYNRHTPWSEIREGEVTDNISRDLQRTRNAERDANGGRPASNFDNKMLRDGWNGSHYFDEFDGRSFVEEGRKHLKTTPTNPGAETPNQQRARLLKEIRAKNQPPVPTAPVPTEPAPRSQQAAVNSNRIDRRKATNTKATSRRFR